RLSNYYRNPVEFARSMVRMKACLAKVPSLSTDTREYVMIMRSRLAALLALGLAGVLGYATASSPPVQPPAATAPVPSDADREAIMKSARDFAEAFNSGDAKGIAAAWAENGECHEASGQTFVGRA